MRAIRCDRCEEFEEGSGYEIIAPITRNIIIVICSKCRESYQKWVKREA